jgi:hypothetical protein
VNLMANNENLVYKLVWDYGPIKLLCWRTNFLEFMDKLNYVGGFVNHQKCHAVSISLLSFLFCFVLILLCFVNEKKTLCKAVLLLSYCLCVGAHVCVFVQCVCVCVCVCAVCVCVCVCVCLCVCVCVH